MRYFKSGFFIILLLVCCVTLSAQEDAPVRVYEYAVPYEYPTVNGIKEVLNRGRTYYEFTCGYFNPNAKNWD